jgi:hypothetical protein
VVRVLLMLVLVVAAVLYSCGQASSPAERQKERAGVERAEPEQLSSGSPKYMDMRAASHAAPEEWPLLACADLGEGG